MLALLLRLLTTPIRYFSGTGAPTLFEDVSFAAIRTLLRHSDLAVSRSIFKPTTEVYEDLCRKTNTQPRSLDVGGVRAHWIGDENAEVVVLYFHGKSTGEMAQRVGEGGESEGEGDNKIEVKVNMNVT